MGARVVPVWPQGEWVLVNSFCSTPIACKIIVRVECRRLIQSLVSCVEGNNEGYFKLALEFYSGTAFQFTPCFVLRATFYRRKSLVVGRFEHSLNVTTAER